MKAVVQRVKQTRLFVDGNLISEIPFGLTVFLGIKTGDSEKEAEYIQTKYNKVNKNEISMEQLKECIKTVTAEERAQALATMKRARIIHREERGIANENDR